MILPEREYELEASSTEERTKWVEGIIHAIEIYKKIEHYIGVETGFDDNTMRKEGPMDLKMGIFGWVEHHLILVDGMLLIYFGKAGPRLYKLPLYGAVVAPLTTGKGVRFGFSIKAEDRSEFVFSSLSEEVATEWMDLVQKQKTNIESALSSITA
eukprot:TRINITY_DN4183_c0_g1_i2.p2 TRINITY_DN4183_c0_g1~~TRINITY_DN4183_c0_g1_i2.p2  ORF type:complete len:155 (-),score=36.77 TRINITY_DN4183_c0_g1_i2:136-600(-)